MTGVVADATILGTAAFAARKRTAINTNRICAVFFGVQNGCLDVEAIAQQVAFIVNDKTHQNRHAVGGISGAGKHGLPDYG